MSNDDIIRDLIKHENDLISARMGWMTALQGFLFTAYSFTGGEDGGGDFREIVSTVGVSIALLTIWGVLSATYAITRILKWWEENKPAGYSGPPVIGLTAENKVLKYITPLVLMPFVIFVAWAYMLYSALC